MMDLTSGNPFWRAKDGFIRTYHPPTESQSCDVVVIGGGITGSILTHALTRQDFQTIVIDRRNFGWGSTCASTALIQYEIDTHLVDLAHAIGLSSAETAYLACRDAIPQIRELSAASGAGFETKESVYFASAERDVVGLRAEFEARRHCGLPVEWMTESDFRQEFDFSAPAGIRSTLAGDLDAFELSHALLHQSVQRGAKAFARTEITSIEPRTNEVVLHTTRGLTLRCRRVVVAAGYESLAFLKQPPPVRIHNTFAFATEPIIEFRGWPRGCLLWETARPYAYGRTTSDGRAIFGGEDLPFKSALIRDRVLPRKISRLQRRFGELFPRIPLELCATWAGTFAETPDGLPYIGFPPEQPETFFALAYGGNGITYSMIAAEMLIAALQGRSHPCASIFRFGRH